VIAALVEGVGVNATSRMTGVAKNTILPVFQNVLVSFLDTENPPVRLHAEAARCMLLAGRDAKTEMLDEWSCRLSRIANMPVASSGFAGRRFRVGELA